MQCALSMVVIFISNHFSNEKYIYTHLQPPFSGHFTVSYFPVDTFYIRKDRSTRNKQQNDLNVLAQVVAYKGLHTPKKWSQLIRRGAHFQAVPATVIIVGILVIGIGCLK